MFGRSRFTPYRRIRTHFLELDNEYDNLLAEDHSELGGLLDESIAAARSGDGTRAFRQLDRFWARLAMHIRAEHLHLFPVLLEAAGISDVEVTISRLREDHNYFMQELAELVKVMRKLTEEKIDDPMTQLKEVESRLERVKERLRTHNEIEELNVYPLTNTALSAEKARTLDTKMRKELENLPPRFTIS